MYKNLNSEMTIYEVYPVRTNTLLILRMLQIVMFPRHEQTSLMIALMNLHENTSNFSINPDSEIGNMLYNAIRDNEIAPKDFYDYVPNYKEVLDYFVKVTVDDIEELRECMMSQDRYSEEYREHLKEITEAEYDLQLVVEFQRRVTRIHRELNRLQ
jgi:hypothetical protein